MTCRECLLELFLLASRMDDASRVAPRTTVAGLREKANCTRRARISQCAVSGAEAVSVPPSPAMVGYSEP